MIIYLSKLEEFLYFWHSLNSLFCVAKSYGHSAHEILVICREHLGLVRGKILGKSDKGILNGVRRNFFSFTAHISPISKDGALKIFFPKGLGGDVFLHNFGGLASFTHMRFCG